MEIPVTKSVSIAATSPVSSERPRPVVAERTPAPVKEPAVTAPADNLPDTREAIAEQVSRFLQSSARNLEFQVDAESSTPVIIVRDGQGHVVRRIPGDTALEMLRLANAQSGTFVNSKA
jgi:uncharacterized FlaG/YvyC family protein